MYILNHLNKHNVNKVLLAFLKICYIIQNMKKKLVISAIIATTLLTGATVYAVNGDEQYQATDTTTTTTQETPIQTPTEPSTPTTQETSQPTLQKNTLDYINTTPKTSTPTTTVQSTSTEPVATPQTEPTSEPAPQPTPPPVVIVNVQQIPVDNVYTNCRYTYSDGTTYEWLWKKVVVNGDITQGNINGNCTNQVVGQTKD